MGIRRRLAHHSASQATIEFPKGGGIVEKTITMPLCTSKDQLTFYSNNYKVFLIDYIKITQDVKAGDKVTTITGSVLTEDADTKSMVMTNPGFSDGHDVLYRVTAMRYDKDSQESHMYYSTSTPSDLMLVKNPILQTSVLLRLLLRTWQVLRVASWLMLPTRQPSMCSTSLDSSLLQRLVAMAMPS